MEKITIYKIAEKAGVSPKTVSRVINREPSVAKKTYEKVLKVIKDTNFVPNVSAQRLVSNRAKAIGLVVPRVGSPYASELISVILNKCKDRKYISVVYPIDKREKEYENVIALYLQRHVDGFIIAPPGGDDEILLSYVKDNNVPTILITPNRPYGNFYIVKATDQRGGYQAAQYLIKLGHKDIGIITCDLSKTFSIERLEGFKQALEENKINLRREFIKEGDNSFRSGFSLTNQLLKEKNPPTAIFACNDEMALGAESAIYKMGLRIPDDVSLIGFDDIPLISELSIPLTTIKQPVEEIGDISVDLLIKLIKIKEIEKKIYKVPTELVIRSSCRTLS